MRSIKATWGVTEFLDIFPKEVRPTDVPGLSALSILNSISIRQPNLANAQQLMLAICKQSDGTYAKMSWKYADLLMKQLKLAQVRLRF